MKANREHRVPLTDRMLELIEKCRNNSPYLFAENGKPLSINALRMLMNRMEVGEYTPHGFRSSFRTWCEEKSNVRDEFAWEETLSHLVGIPASRPYRRIDNLETREKLMNEWCIFVSTV